MLESLTKRQARVTHALRCVGEAMYDARRPLQVSAWHVPGEPVPPAQAFAAAYTPFALGERWGPRWGTTWFRVESSIPNEWSGREVVARLNFGFASSGTFGGEALVYEGGRPRQGLAPCRTDYRITPAAAGGEHVLLHVEAAANPGVPAQAFKGLDWPELEPDPGGEPLFELVLAELATVDPEVVGLFHDMRVLKDLCAALSVDDPRAVEVFAALEQACAALSLTDIAGTATAARALLAPALAKPAHASAHKVSAVGHAHLDTAWLWPVRETRRKAARTFANALRLMDAYPEFRFLASQPQQYQWIFEDHPELFNEIRDQVKAGQFEPVGAMWVEADCNIPSGESLARQLIHGKRFFLEHFDHESREVWLPDVFGYSASLPQIMREAGCDFFLTQKMSWNDTNRFPHHTMWWEGLDGSRVFTHFPPANTYIGDMTVPELVDGANRFAHHGVSDRSLYPFGFGDGGGGPIAEMMESARRLADLEGAPRVSVEPAAEFFRKASAELTGQLPVWVGELYAEFHRGTYTTQAATKRANRFSEHLLAAAELWSTFAPGDYPHEALDRAWKLLLLSQFHDIIPGSSIAWVYRDTMADHAEIARLAGAARDRALRSIVDDVDGSGLHAPVALFNQVAHDRSEIVVVPAAACATAPTVAVDAEGASLPVQVLDDGGLAFPADVPSCGYAVYDLRAAADTIPPVGSPVRVGDGWMANDRLRVEWDGDGLLTSITDLRNGREVLADGERGNVFQIFDDYPAAFDAWDIDANYVDSRRDLVVVDEIAITETGPLRASVRFIRSFGASRIVQTMRLASGSALLRFDTEIDWHESHRLLKVGFPTNVQARRASHEIQFGHVERPTHSNTSWDAAQFETCAQRWVDLSEADYGVALLNNGKYGHDVKGATIRLTLLRAPGAPDPTADRGHHAFSYALLPHAGTAVDANVVAHAAAFNAPLHAVAAPTTAGVRPRRWSFVGVDTNGIEVSAVKRADAGDGIVVRVYESFGGRRSARLRVDGARSAVRTDLLEREVAPVAVTDGAVELTLTPFALRTFVVEAES